MAVIAIDYDDTYTLDPDFWLAFIYLAKMRGHEVICVTMRPDAKADRGVPAMDEELLQAVHYTYFTNYQAKRDFLEKLGVTVGVWIDDNPEWVLFDAG